MHGLGVDRAVGAAQAAATGQRVVARVGTVEHQTGEGKALAAASIPVVKATATGGHGDHVTADQPRVWHQIGGFVEHLSQRNIQVVKAGGAVVHLLDARTQVHRHRSRCDAPRHAQRIHIEHIVAGGRRKRARDARDRQAAGRERGGSCHSGLIEAAPGLRHGNGGVPIDQALHRVGGRVAVEGAQLVVDLADLSFLQAHGQRGRAEGDGVAGVGGERVDRARDHARAGAWQAVIAGLESFFVRQSDGAHKVVDRAGVAIRPGHARAAAGDSRNRQHFALHQIAQREHTKVFFHRFRTVIVGLGDSACAKEVGGVVHLGCGQRQRARRDHAIRAGDGAAGQAVVVLVGPAQRDVGQRVAAASAGIGAVEAAAHANDLDVVTADFARGGCGCRRSHHSTVHAIGAVIDLDRVGVGRCADAAPADVTRHESRCQIHRVVRADRTHRAARDAAQGDTA